MASTPSTVEFTVNVAAATGPVVARRSPRAAMPREKRTIPTVGTVVLGL
jgi:hypothetical protein